MRQPQISARLREKSTCGCLSAASTAFHFLFIHCFHLLGTLITQLLEYVIVSIDFCSLRDCSYYVWVSTEALQFFQQLELCVSITKNRCIMRLLCWVVFLKGSEYGFCKANCCWTNMLEPWEDVSNHGKQACCYKASFCIAISSLGWGAKYSASSEEHHEDLVELRGTKVSCRADRCTAVPLRKSALMLVGCSAWCWQLQGRRGTLVL